GTPERTREAGPDRRGDRGVTEGGRAESERPGSAMEAAPLAPIQRRVRGDFDRREKADLQPRKKGGRGNAGNHRPATLRERDSVGDESDRKRSRGCREID